jgi:hypothetical protein
MFKKRSLFDVIVLLKRKRTTKEKEIQESYFLRRIIKR